MNEDFDTHGPSKNCEMVKKDECKFEACDVKLNGPRKCVGGALALFVYKVYKIRKRVFLKKRPYLVTQNIFPRYYSLW